MGRLPDVVVACVGGGSNAAGMFYPLVDDATSRTGGGGSGWTRRSTGRSCLAVEPRQSRRAARQLQLRDARRRRSDGDVHSISAGLDYPGVGPEHSYWKSCGRVRYVSRSDAEALVAFDELARMEGILPALETSHAIAEAMHLAATRLHNQRIVVCLSGRGDKDTAELSRLRSSSDRR